MTELCKGGKSRRCRDGQDIAWNLRCWENATERGQRNGLWQGAVELDICTYKTHTFSSHRSLTDSTNTLPSAPSP